MRVLSASGYLTLFSLGEMALNQNGQRPQPQYEFWPAWQQHGKTVWLWAMSERIVFVDYRETGALQDPKLPSLLDLLYNYNSNCSQKGSVKASLDCFIHDRAVCNFMMVIYT